MAFHIRNVNVYTSRLKALVRRFEGGIATRGPGGIPVSRSTITPGYAIWYTGERGGDLLEAHWIEFLFSHGPERSNKTNVLVINSWDRWRPVVEKIVDRKKWLLVVVDENNWIAPEILRSFLFSLRVGFATTDYGQGVVTVPLNVPGPFLDAAAGVAADKDRQYLWCFAGDGSKQDRPEMLQSLGALQPHFVHTYTGWLPKEALKQESYARVLRGSIFAPSPSGNIHPECYRTYEAIHCGSVPIVTTRYYEDQFEAPFPVAENWAKACGLLEALLHDEDELARIREACMRWYRDMPNIFRRRVADALRTTGQI